MSAIRALSVCCALALVAACGTSASQGPSGDAGPPGATGPTGPAGPTGAEGATGATGLAGAAGVPGSAGVPGAAGPAGATGAQGPVGATGAQGPAGATGAAGAAGASVTESVIAPGDPNCPAGGVKYTLAGNASSAVYVCNGENGDAGPQGPQGLAGLNGATGAQGATGNTGAPGPTGAQGLPGAVGAQGPQGNNGATGAAGAQGVAGATGATGAIGATGPQGSSGAQGVAGATGAIGPTGAIGAVGATGPQGPSGAQGIAGLTGAIGPTGAVGATGATGTFSGQAILNQTALQSNANFNIDGNGYIGSALGVGTTSPKQVIDTANGRVRANGVVFLPSNGTNYGKLTVFNQGSTTSATVPFSTADITANPGVHLEWTANGPRLGDTSACGGGSDPSYYVDNSSDTGWPGQYSVTFLACGANYPCVTGTWEGWEMRLFNASNQVVAGPLHSFVHFTLAYESGVWRVEHMSGMVGTTAFECN